MRDIELTKQNLISGTESLQKVPLGGLKETFENTLNVTPSISGRAAEIASIIGEAIAKIREDSAGINEEAKKHLADTSKDYALVCAADPDNDPPDHVKALWLQFDEVHSRTEEVVGSPGRWGNTLDLISSFEKMQGHLEALDAEIANYEGRRNGTLSLIDQAEIARVQTIDQATALRESL